MDILLRTEPAGLPALSTTIKNKFNQFIRDYSLKESFGELIPG